ncbi:hypothetical protein KAR91_52370 [Candidatus Pacearchaeota archaeon]|nr:hypothetical protein [Candidatus Pacearchaeota archaeon]
MLRGIRVCEEGAIVLEDEETLNVVVVLQSLGLIRFSFDLRAMKVEFNGGSLEIRGVR